MLVARARPVKWLCCEFMGRSIRRSLNARMWMNAWMGMNNAGPLVSGTDSHPC